MRREPPTIPIFARRGSPERIFPELAASDNAVASQIGFGAGTWGATWNQISAGNIGWDALVAGMVVAGRVVSTLTANGTTIKIFRMANALAVGAAGSEVEIARAIWGVGAFESLSGLVDDAVTASGQAEYLLGERFDPQLVASGTRLSWRTNQQGVSAAEGHRIYVVTYDAAALEAALIPYPLDLRRWANGVDKHHPDDINDVTETTLTLSGTAWDTATGWTQIIASLADDYLLCGMTVAHDENSDAQFDFALGVAGSEVIHARAGAPTGFGIAGLPWAAGRPIPFPIPWVAYKGERVAGRVLGSLASAQPFEVRLHGSRLYKD